MADGKRELFSQDDLIELARKANDRELQAIAVRQAIDRLLERLDAILAELREANRDRA